MAPDALLRLEQVSKRFAGGIVGLDNIDLEVSAGEFLSLLGPSGCGKTTTLRVIAGFEHPTGGRVLLDGMDITPLRPFDRPVNTVFQDYALFPHLNVEENVAFGLSVRKVPRQDQAKRVASVLEMVGLADKLHARVSALSGGQRQRVALARAIVCEPRILLLDEPLSALDAHLREQMQVELKRLQSQLGVTFVIVTHDQAEALSISNRIVVMNRGRIEQIAAPATLYDRPTTEFVAGFIGTMNLLAARCVSIGNGSAHFDVNGLAAEAPVSDAISIGELNTIGVRPEDLEISYDPAPGAAPFQISSVVFQGRTLRIRGILAGDTELVVDAARDSAGTAVRAGDRLQVRVRPKASGVVLAASRG